MSYMQRQVSFKRTEEPFVFAKVSKQVFQMGELSSGAVTVYAYMSGLVSATSPFPFPSYQRIADECHMSRRTAINKIKELLKAGLLEKRATYSKDYREQKSNAYNVLPIPDEDIARKNEMIAKLELDRYRRQILKKSTSYVSAGKELVVSFAEKIKNLKDYLRLTIREWLYETYFYFLKKGGSEKSAPYKDSQNTDLHKNNITNKKKKRLLSNLVTCNIASRLLGRIRIPFLRGKKIKAPRNNKMRAGP